LYQSSARGSTKELKVGRLREAMLYPERTEEDGMTLILDVSADKEPALKAKAQARGVSPEQYVQGMLDHDLEAVEATAATPPRRHISDVIREIWSDVPAESWDTMPTDGASEHDHYIYGLPKRNP
jgi:hypothetical protein